MSNIHILSIETSGDICSVGLSENGKLLSDYTSFEKFSHDRLLAEYARNILADYDLRVDDLSAVGVSSGPGSFTGLRVGVSLAKSLCFGDEAKNPKLISVPTLQAFAYSTKNINNKSNIISIIPSHRELFYVQEFDSEANPLGEIELLEKNQILIKYLIDKPEANALNIKMISDLANKLYEDSDFVDPEDFKPIYAQKFIPKNHKSENLS
jgi:tRNA threonylcarbamoyladenosine biosynthesis protein TsaB